MTSLCKTTGHARPTGLAILLAVGLLCAMRGTPDPAHAAGPTPRSPAEPKVTAAERAHWAFQKPARPAIPQVGDSGWVRTPVDAFILSRLEKAGLKPAPAADRATLLRRVTFDLIGLPPTPQEVEDFLHDARPEAYVRVVDRLLASPHYGERRAQHWLDVVRYAESNGYEVDGERPHAWRYRDYVVRAFNDDKPYNRFVIEQLAGDELARGQDPRQHAELLIATGFNRCGPMHIVAGNTDPDVNRQEILTELTDAVGSAFLGLTLGCARCHDHKFDPISQADYYRMQAFFAAAQPKDIELATAAEKAAQDEQVKELKKELEPLRKKIAALEDPYKALLTELKKAALEDKYRDALEMDPKKRTAEQQKLAAQAAFLIKVSWDELVAALTPEERAQRAAWRAQIQAIEARMPPPPAHAWAISDLEKTPPTHVLKRGDPKQPGPQVEPAVPRIFASRVAEPGLRAEKPSPTTLPPPDPLVREEKGSETPFPSPGDGKGDGTGGRSDRVALARWLTRSDHPLTARVLVNRLWQHHFGRGLVATPNDVGLHGDKPTHPELLDWLACELVAHGWSLKHMDRLMVLSNTYQQASRGDPSLAKGADPDNRLLWRMNRQRLEGEALRDGILAVSGSLYPKLGGPMVRVPLEPEVYEQIFTEGEPDGLWHVTPDPREHARRSIYLFAKRNLRLPLFEVFDRPDMLTSCPVRPVSTFTPQAFILLNGPFVQQESKAFAARLLRDCCAEVDGQIDLAYRLALARPPKETERSTARQFLSRQADLLRDRLRARLPVSIVAEAPSTIDPAAAAALADFCLALLNRNAFIYVD